MGSERRLDYQLVRDIALQEAELVELSKALGLADRLVCHVERLVADDQLEGAITPLDQLGVADHL